jgi:uncharacterized iron-regulated membrane protein
VLPSGTDTLTPRIFRALYSTFDLHILGGAYVAVPTGTPWFSGDSLGDIAQQISQHEYPAPAQPTPEATPPDSRPPLPRRPATEPPPASSLPCPEDAAQIAAFLRERPSWSAFWDKEQGVWRVTEDDPDSGLYAASGDICAVIDYMTLHS